VTSPLLEIADLTVAFPSGAGPVRAVDGVSLRAERGRTLGIVGESGSGKSVTFLAATRLLPSADVAGRILLDGRDLLTLPPGDLRDVRGSRIGMIFQDPLAALHPLLRIGDQLAETVRAHRDVSRRDARERAVAALRGVGIPNPDERARQYAHQLSGGMRQRVMIAMALIAEPDLLIADEPTTALDTTVEAQILDLIDRQRRDAGLGIVLISHSLATVAQVADDVAVMYAGRVIEAGPAAEVFTAPNHPYTWGLLDSIPAIGADRAPLTPIPGAPPSPLDMPPGCRFAPRCRYRLDACSMAVPPLAVRGSGHADACILPIDGRAGLRRTPAAVGPLP
jgi:peptide/nickel transport system ATP-binding protein